jgi:hypothetical protein
MFGCQSANCHGVAWPCHAVQCRSVFQQPPLAAGKPCLLRQIASLPLPFFQRALGLASLLPNSLLPQVLDVGSGCGVLTACCAYLVGRLGTVVGVDIRRDCVRICKDNVRRLAATSGE